MLSEKGARLFNEQVTKLNKQIIKLNVGGTPFYASYETLRLSPFFQDLVSSTKSLDIPIFIDRSNQLFVHIMQYLRDGRINASDNLMALQVEAKHYQLSDLVEKLDDLIKNPMEERDKEYQLIEFDELKRISKITPEQGTTQAICDVYDVISVVSYDGAYWVCSNHGEIKYCPAVCNGQMTSKWTQSPTEKLLIRKK